jgi:hypothetical protein
MRYLQLIIIACGVAAFFTAAHAKADCDAECWHALVNFDPPASFNERFVLAQVGPTPVAPATLPVTQNTVTTTGPVTSDTTISVGTLAGQVLEWVLAAFGVPIGSLITAWLFRAFRQAGINLTDSIRARLQQIVLNGMHLGALEAQKQLQGRGQVDIRNAAVAATIAYVRVHGTDELKALGINPNSNVLTEVVKARIAALAADPTVATPPVLNAPMSPPPTTVAPAH